MSALYAVNHWEREGVVRTRSHGRHRFVSLNPDFAVAAELAGFLMALLCQSDEYRDLADAVR